MANTFRYRHGLLEPSYLVKSVERYSGESCELDARFGADLQEYSTYVCLGLLYVQAQRRQSGNV
jgi:hypothetical protein